MEVNVKEVVDAGVDLDDAIASKLQGASGTDDGVVQASGFAVVGHLQDEATVLPILGLVQVGEADGRGERGVNEQLEVDVVAGRKDSAAVCAWVGFEFEGSLGLPDQGG